MIQGNTHLQTTEWGIDLCGRNRGKCDEQNEQPVQQQHSNDGRGLITAGQHHQAYIVCYLIHTLLLWTIKTSKLHFPIKCASRHHKCVLCVSLLWQLTLCLLRCLVSIIQQKGLVVGMITFNLHLSLSLPLSLFFFLWEDNGESCLFVRPVSSHHPTETESRSE